MSQFWNSDPSTLFWGNGSSFFWQDVSVLYSYDLLGRLVQVAFANGTSIVYSYDSVGNRTSVVITCGSSGC
jgi:YD repeat-containing protein